MQELLVERAAEADVAALVGLREQLEDWLAGRAIEQWGRGEVPREAVAAQVADGQWWVVRPPGGLVAALRLLWSDPPVWQEEDAFAGYVHGLMVDRAHAGRGTGAALLTWAEQQARAAGAPALRLDCVESNAALRAFYARQGFREVGRRDFDGPWYSAVLLEKPL